LPQPAVSHGNALEVDELTDRTQNLQIQSNNPFHQRQSTASASGSNTSSQNPFLANPSSASQSRRPSRRSTPAAGHSTDRYTSVQRGDSAAGYLSPPQAYALDPRSQTPPGGAHNAQQAASRLPRSYTSHSLSRTSQGHGYSQPTVQPSRSSMRGFRVMKAKELRSFFKPGRVFKTFWTQTTASNNPFGEILRFVVIRPHRTHSTCLAIHTYGQRATTAPSARPRDHLVIYTGNEVPDLVEGESEAVLDKDPVRVTLDPKGDALLPESRLSLIKLQTVEHSVPVAIVGKIAPSDLERIRQYSGVYMSADRTAEVLDDFEEGDELED